MAKTPSIAYLPLARKYRPQSFAALIGQEAVATTLTNAIASGHIAHAYLFAGPRGTGKTSTARIFAKSLNCEQGPTAKPCQHCTSCEEITKGSSLDVLEIDGASNRGIDEVRQLRDSVKFAPARSRTKAYIIDEVHQITGDGFNALLKTLEEPPAHVVFIFATTAPQKVPATILSRCQRFDFRRIPAARVVEQLKAIAKQESIPIDEGSLFAIARAADGSLRDAESVLDQLSSFSQERIRPADVHAVLGVVETETLAHWAEAILTRRLPEALAFVDRLLDSGKELEQITQGLIEHFRHLIVLKACPSGGEAVGARRLVELPEETLRLLAAQAAPAALEDLLGMAQVLLHAQQRMSRSPLARVILDVALVHLATRAELQPIDELVGKLDALLAHGGGNATASAPPPRLAPPQAVSQIVRDPAPVSPALPKVPIARAVVAPESVAVPAPVNAPALSTDEVHALWPRLLDRIGRVKMSTAAYLSEGRPLDGANGTLRIGLPPGSLHWEILDTPEMRRGIEETLAGLLDGARLRVAFVKNEAEPQPVAAAAPMSMSPPSPAAYAPQRAHTGKMENDSGWAPTGVGQSVHQVPDARHHPAPDIIQKAMDLFGGQMTGGSAEPPAPTPA